MSLTAPSDTPRTNAWFAALFGYEENWTHGQSRAALLARTLERELAAADEQLATLRTDYNAVRAEMNEQCRLKQDCIGMLDRLRADYDRRGAVLAQCLEALRHSRPDPEQCLAARRAARAEMKRPQP